MSTPTGGFETYGHEVDVAVIREYEKTAERALQRIEG